MSSNCHRKFLLSALLLVSSAGLVRTTYAQDSIARYARQEWTAEDGLRVGPISSIAQTPDGDLWIGGEEGLLAFDGQKFEAVGSSGQSKITHVLGLTTDSQGGLWVWMQGANVLRFTRGSFTNITDEVGMPDANITSLSRDLAGNVLMSTLGQQIFEYKDGRASEVGWTSIPNTLMLALAKTADGRVWVGTRDAGLFHLEHHQFISVADFKAPKKINCLLASRDGRLWVGTDEGLFVWHGNSLTSVAGPAAFKRAQVLSMVQDRDGNLWCGTNRGLFRVSGAAESDAAVTVYLAEQSITGLYDDREGDLWIGTARALQRWKYLPFQECVAESDRHESAGGPVYVDSRQTAWIGSLDGGLYRCEQNRMQRVKPDLFGDDVIYSLAGRDGELWAGRQNGGITHIFESSRGLADETFTTSAGLVQNSVFSVLQARDGTLWAGTLSAGLSRFKNGAWHTFTKQDGLPSNTISVMAEGPGGDLWVGTPNGLASLSHGRWRVFDQNKELPSDDITSILPDLDETRTPLVWVGTAGGMAVLRAGVIRTIRSGSDLLHEPIWGMTTDNAGFIWLSTPNQLARVSRRTLLSGTVESTDFRVYGRMDGVEQAGGVRRSRGITTDSAGNVWVSTVGGVVVTTSAYMRHPAVSTIVTLQSIVADNGTISLTSPSISGPQRRIAFNYTGVNFSGGARVRFRYRLDAFDKDWSEPVTGRQAVYTHLDPGSYRFRVIASNGDGLWNSNESSSLVIIKPATWQTWWFRLSCVLAMLMISWLLYARRVRQLTAQNTLLFEERLAERMRIAQDLHDTLLQSLHALVLRFQAVSNLLPQRPREAKEILEVAIDRAAEALIESRDAVQQLRRPSNGSSDLAEVLTLMGHELGETHLHGAVLPNFRVVVEGVPQPINPMVRDDLYRIGREAIGNAFRHAQATQIEVDLTYQPRALTLRVRDDGIGIDSTLLERGGRDGHWGLPGMRERAKGWGGRFNLWSQLHQGTEIEVSIPRAVAYSTTNVQQSNQG